MIKWILFLLLFILAGCASDRGVEKVSLFDNYKVMDRSALTGDRLSFETKQYLIEAGLYEKWHDEPYKVIEILSTNELENYTLKSIMELCYAGAKNADTERKNELLLSCTRYAYIYLDKSEFSPRVDLFINEAVEYYNQSLTHLLDDYQQKNIKLVNLTTNKVVGKIVLQTAVKSEMPHRLGRIDNYYLAERYAAEGLLEEGKKHGLGVTIIAEKNPETNKVDNIFWHGMKLSYPATLTVAFIAGPSNQYDKMAYTLWNSVEKKTIKVNKRELPLASDITTPLAFLLERNASKDVSGLKGMLNVKDTKDLEGLRMLTLYDPEKIPVIFVHGLMSSPMTWMDMFNSLICDEEINSRYQFWFYRYSSGNNILMTASRLRASLEEVYQRYSTNQIHRLDDTVIVGHSMGGLVSKLVLKDSSNMLWHVNTDYPFEKLDIPTDEKEYLRKIFFFQHAPFIKRAIFMATPHRGAEMAETWYGHLSSRLIKYPDKLINRTRDITKALTLQSKRKGFILKNLDSDFKSGIENLSPDDPFMQAALKLPYNTNLVYHSVMGNDTGPFENIDLTSDGIVPYWSSHLDGATSELIVESSHSVHEKRVAIDEVKRILKEHYDEVENKK